MTTLPEKNLYRIGEVADYFGVTHRTVYLWIEHCQLEVEYTPAGQIRITKQSIDRCRFKKKKNGEIEDD